MVPEIMQAVVKIPDSMKKSTGSLTRPEIALVTVSAVMVNGPEERPAGMVTNSWPRSGRFDSTAARMPPNLTSGALPKLRPKRRT